MSAMNLVRIERETGIRQRQVDLPATYAHAVATIKACASVDELMNMANHAEAAAGHYKVWKDTDGEYYMRRIKTRAVIEMGKHLSMLNPQASGLPRSKRMMAMEAAGIDPSVGSLAVRAARVQESTREQMIEARPPASVHQIAKVAPSFAPATARRSAAANLGDGSMLTKFFAWSMTVDPKRFSKGFNEHDVQELKKRFTAIEGWMQDVERNLPKHSGRRKA